MPTLTTISIICSILFGASTLYFALKNNKRTDTQDITNRATSDAIINVKLDNISNTTTEIRNEVKTMREDVKEIDRRLTVVEESTKQAHHRLDDFGVRLNAEKE